MSGVILNEMMAGLLGWAGAFYRWVEIGLPMSWASEKAVAAALELPPRTDWALAIALEATFAVTPTMLVAPAYSRDQSSAGQDNFPLNEDHLGSDDQMDFKCDVVEEVKRAIK